MSKQPLLSIDIEPRARTSAEGPLWTRSDNSFQFNFLLNQDVSTGIRSPASSSSLDQNQLNFTAQGTTFAFNFDIQPVEAMDTAPGSTSANMQQCTEQGSPSNPLQNTPASTQSAKKKKKGTKHKTEGNLQRESNESTVNDVGSEEAEPSAEEQLQRQLDWCIEQLEQGMRSQKATTKQKEEASRALKTLRSSKAPLVKKRQLMRVMAGDYRKKMEEEKSKQFKLIQNETASAQLRAVSELPKQSVFHRKAGIKASISESDTKANFDATTELEKSFVFSPSKEEFRFNFF